MEYMFQVRGQYHNSIKSYKSCSCICSSCISKLLRFLSCDFCKSLPLHTLSIIEKVNIVKH